MISILDEKNKTYNIDQINILAASVAEELINEMEILYKDIVKRTALKILEQKNDYTVLMLAGPSGSGKTTTSKILCETINNLGGNAITISMDDFYMGIAGMPVDENGKKDFESVYAINIPKLKVAIASLLITGKAEIPRYNFKESKPYDYTDTITLSKGGIAIIEGIHAFNPIFTNDISAQGLIKVYVSVENSIDCKNDITLTSSDLRLIRRLIRDNFFRNSDANRTLYMWEDVIKGENKNIIPYKNNGDYYINTFHIYEVCVFKKYIISLLNNVDKNHLYYNLAQHIIKAVDNFIDINVDFVPSNSLVREFIGDSKYYKS